MPKTRWGMVVLLILCGVIGAFQVGKAAVAVPVLQQELGLTLFAAAIIVGAYGLLGAVIALPAGLMMSLYSARKTLIAGLAAIGCGSLLGAFTESGNLLIATRILEGFGFVCVILSAPRLFAPVIAREDSPMVFAFWGSYMPTGSAIMMLAGPFLIQLSGWQGLWLFNGVLALGYALVIARLDLPDTAQQQPAESSLMRNLRAGFATPGPLLVAVTFGTYTFQYFALSSLFPALLVDRMGLSIAAAGFISAAAVLANAAGNFAAGALLRLGVPLWIVLSAGFVTSGLFAFGVFSDALPVAAVAGFAAASLAITGIIPASLFAAASVIAPTSALLAVTLGLVTQVGISGQLLGPTVLAAGVERFGWESAPLLFVAVMCVGIMLALALRRESRRARSVTTP